MAEIDAFETFFREQYAPLVALGAWLTGDRGTGEDLAQEALGTTHRRWADVAGYEKPGAFTRRTMVNLAANERRRRGREARAMRRASSSGPPTHEDAGAMASASLAHVWVEVAALPLQQRAAVGMRYLDGLPTAEIADALGCSESTVRVHLHRAHRRLAERLGADLVPTPTPHDEPEEFSP